MNNHYHHYLITRFNLKYKDWTVDKNNNPLAIADENWLKERFELFDTYCFPSVKAQTVQNFKWLVYFDVDTPEKYKQLIRRYEKEFPNFLPKFIPGMQHLFDSIKNDIVANVNDLVVTSRLDNDDALHENYMERVHSYIENNKITHGVVDIPNGYCLQINNKPILYRGIQYSNAFVTYIEPYLSGKELVTVMGKQHVDWAYSVKTFFIKNEKLWMQIIHDKNVLNKAQGIIVNDKDSLAGFHFKTGIDFSENNLPQFIVNNYLKFPVYFLKKQLKKYLIKLRIMKRLVKSK